MIEREPDERIRSRVEDELAWDFFLDESQIVVDVTDGVVTLAGTVASYAEKVLAQHLIREVSGVHDLVNAIDVKPEADRHPADDRLTVMVESVLAWDAFVPEQDIVVRVADGMVALTGSCATRAQAEEAERSVTRLYGVRGVLNRIQILPPSPTPADVRSTIGRALRRRAAHQAAELDITVAGQSVTLRGTVPSATDRQAVIDAAGDAPGIDRIDDELQIEG